jgi:hypothetical protein
MLPWFRGAAPRPNSAHAVARPLREPRTQTRIHSCSAGAAGISMTTGRAHNIDNRGQQVKFSLLSKRHKWDSLCLIRAPVSSLPRWPSRTHTPHTSRRLIQFTQQLACICASQEFFVGTARALYGAYYQRIMISARWTIFPNTSANDHKALAKHSLVTW